LSNKLKVAIGILIEYLTVIELLGFTKFKHIYFPQTDLFPPESEPAVVKISGFLNFVASDIVAPKILVSYTKSKFSVIVRSLQQI
jgi:hypothetical protein